MNPLLELIGRDGVDVTALRSVYDRCGAHPKFVSHAIGTLGQLASDDAWRAVWLLKRAVADLDLNGEDLRKIAELVDSSDHWVFRLTTCQLLAATGCPPELREQVFPFLQRCFGDRRTIIRAWALSGLIGFESDPLYRGSIQQMKRAAQRDSSKSMQARLRRLKPKLV